MQITVTNDGIAVTDALRQYVEEKFKRLSRLIPVTSAIHVTLSLENLEQVAKVLIHAHGTEFYASAQSTDLYTAIDALIDKTELQIVKHKQKEKEKRHDKTENLKEKRDLEGDF